MFKSEDHKVELGTPKYHEEAQKIIRVYGTQSEVERLEAGLLPDHEYENIVADVLFDTILDMPIRRKIKDTAVRQIAVRRGQATWDDNVTFENVDAADSLNEEQWKVLKEIKRRMPKAEVSPFYVVAVCGTYEQRHAAAKVEVKLGERIRRLDVYLELDFFAKNRTV
jgi:hypothetical protein